MANLSDFYLIVYFMAAVGSVVTAVVTWWLCLIMKKGLDEHIGMMQLIYDEILKSSRPDGNPAKRPPDPP